VNTCEDTPLGPQNGYKVNQRIHLRSLVPKRIHLRTLVLNAKETMKCHHPQLMQSLLSKVAVARDSHKLFLSLTGEFE
jgi:hypothetical protein